MKIGADFEHGYEVQDLVNAVAAVSESIGAEYNRNTLTKALLPMRRLYEGSGTAYRASTKKGSGINIRYFNLTVPHNPHELAVKSGLIPDIGHPCMQIIPYISENFEMYGNDTGYGVDISSNHGFEKIWVMFNPTVPLAEVLEIPGLPKSVEANKEYLNKHGLKRIAVLGVDYLAKTLNLYFLAWEMGGLDPGKVVQLIGDLNMVAPASEVIDHCARAMPVYYTFSWSSPQIKRISFACFAPEPFLVPDWDPMMKKFVESASSVAQKPLYFYNPTFASDNQPYYKVELAFDDRYVTEFMKLAPKQETTPPD